MALMLMVVLAAAMAMVAVVVVLISLDPPACRQFFQNILKRGLLLTGERLEQLRFLQVAVAHKTPAPVKQAGQAAHVLMLVAAALFLARHTKIVPSPAALKRIRRTVSAALRTGLPLMIFHYLIHNSSSSIFIRHLAIILPQRGTIVKRNI